MNTYEGMCWMEANKLDNDTLKARLDKLSELSLSEPIHMTNPAKYTQFIVFFKAFRKRFGDETESIKLPSETVTNEDIPNINLMRFLRMHSIIKKEISDKIIKTTYNAH